MTTTEMHRPARRRLKRRIIMQHPDTGEMVSNPSCSGCYCHFDKQPTPRLVEGNCVDCGCPHTLTAFEIYKAAYGLYQKPS